MTGSIFFVAGGHRFRVCVALAVSAALFIILVYGRNSNDYGDIVGAETPEQ